jgi:hypothetical protein
LQNRLFCLCQLEQCFLRSSTKLYSFCLDGTKKNAHYKIRITLRKVCTCQKLKFAFLLLEYCKIRECYAVANAFTIRNMYSLLLYMNCNSANSIVDLSRLQFTSDESEFIPDYI